MNDKLTDVKNYLFIALTVVICFLFGALMWLFSARIKIDGEITAWIIRAAFLLSVILTGFVIYFKFGRANNTMQEIVLWVGIGVELAIMALTFLSVVHPELIVDTDIERFAGLVSGFNVITTVFVLVLYFAFDDSTKGAQKIVSERKEVIRTMYQQQLNSQETHDMVREQVRHDVRVALARDMGIPSYQMQYNGRTKEASSGDGQMPQKDFN